MRIVPSHRHQRLRIGVAAAFVIAACVGVAFDAYAAVRLAVSQQERVFHPNRLEITAGDTVSILNDDGELIHHAYVASDDFNFDSGEQDPGSITNIHFTRAGTFVVHCRIHPKMALIVTVK